MHLVLQSFVRFFEIGQKSNVGASCPHKSGGERWSLVHNYYSGCACVAPVETCGPVIDSVMLVDYFATTPEDILLSNLFHIAS